MRRDRADQHVDAGADGDADAVEREQRQAEPAAQRGRQLDRGVVLHGGKLGGAAGRRLARGQNPRGRGGAR
jgi:hypothetical protein